MLNCLKQTQKLLGIRIEDFDSPTEMEKYLKKWYKKKNKTELNLKNPKTFNEKIQWLKLYDTTLLKTQLTDKYLVREWIKEKTGSDKYLCPLYGVWDRFEDIDFDKLPDKFVLKANHGCAMNIIVKDKSKLNKKVAAKKIKKWLHRNYAYRNGLELQYKNIEPKIIAEAYLEDSNGELNDYKILCFNGKPEFIWVDKGRYSDHTRNIYDINWNLQPFSINYPNSKEEILPPDNLNEMIEIAKVLSEGFYHVRVDLYNVDNKIYFGEMTFTTSGGKGKFLPEEYNLKLGEMMKLPIKEAPKLLVSLTSFPFRIPSLHITIESLLRQTMKPDMIILNLSEDEFPNKENDLPENLLRLRNFGLAINWVKGNIKSYKKLVPTILKYPNDIIITVDDDIIYDKNLVKLLWASYEKNPDCIHCHRTTKMILTKDGNFETKPKKSYKKPAFANKLVGCGGVLYPPNSLYKDITDEELFMKLAPTNDDIWFWLMAVLNDTKIKIIKHNISKPKVLLEAKQGPCLWKVNDKGERLFMKDLERVFNHYKGLREKVIEDISKSL